MSLCVVLQNTDKMHLAVLTVHGACIVASGRQIIFDEEPH